MKGAKFLSVINNEYLLPTLHVDRHLIPVGTEADQRNSCVVLDHSLCDRIGISATLQQRAGDMRGLWANLEGKRGRKGTTNQQPLVGECQYLEINLLCTQTFRFEAHALFAG